MVKNYKKILVIFILFSFTISCSKNRFVQWYIDGEIPNKEDISNNSWGMSDYSYNKNFIIDNLEEIKSLNSNNDIVIALIDTGVNICNFYLKDNLWKNEGEIVDDGIDNDNNGYIDDVYGWNFVEDNSDISTNQNHGDLMLGLLIEKNGSTSLLSETTCKVMNIKAISKSSSFDTICSAIRYAEDNGADICCLCTNTYVDSSELYNTIKQSSMLFVVSAGNDGMELGEVVSYPAMYNLDNIITVGDIRCDGKISETSNYSNKYVDIGAPGTDILSCSNGKYEYISGTSPATVIATGIIAITISKLDINTDELKENFKQTYISSCSNYESLRNKIKEGRYVSFDILND